MMPQPSRPSATFNRAPNRRRPRSAFTLLEVLLAVGISLVVLAALGYMIDFQLRSLDQSRARVEETQLARAVMQRMADDIRSAVRYDPLDFASFMPASAGSLDLSSLDTGDLASASAGGSDSSASGGGGSSPPADDSSASDSSLSTETPPPIPGLYGGIDERGLNMVQVDISRLPRLDEYQQLVTITEDGSAIDHVSDVKTITYFIHPTMGGLVRRVRSRVSDQYAAEMGAIDNLGDEMAIIAPEVVDLQFRYFDGTEWVYEWDSNARKGLPLAVEITLAFLPHEATLDAPSDGAQGLGSSSSYGGMATMNFAPELLRVYRLVVHLPAAEPTTLNDTSGTTEEDSSSGSSSSSSGSSSGSGG